MFCFVHIASYVCGLWFTVMLYVFKKFMFVHVVLCQFSLSCYECSRCMFIFVSLFTFQIVYFPCCICCIFLYMLYLVRLVVLVISDQIFLHPWDID